MGGKCTIIDDEGTPIAVVQESQMEVEYENIINFPIEGYFESVWNNLPAWSDRILPPEIQKHIMDHHSIQRRLGMLLNRHRQEIQGRFRNLKELNKFNNFKRRMEDKINAMERGESFDVFSKDEKEVIEFLVQWEEKDLYPFHMVESQIMKTVRLAYEDARKAPKRKPKPVDEEQDKKNSGTQPLNAMRYQSQVRDMIIHLWFDRDAKIITTAYPVIKHPENIRQDKLPSKH